MIKEVRVEDFRCHENRRQEFTQNVTQIIGPNGSGKTSILEAVYIALQGKSFRAVDREIVRRGAKRYKVVVFMTNGEKIVVDYSDMGSVGKEFFINDGKFKRLPKKYKYPVVLFLPEDLGLVGASPTRKREYFDRVLSAVDEKYSSLLSKYNKALKQRNELLKSEYVREDDLFSWNVLLAQYGLMVREARIDLVVKINKKLTEVYQSIADNNDVVRLDYVLCGDAVDESGYLKRLSESFMRDKVLGHTEYGIHKDNYEFYFNEAMADGSASRGEVRSVVLALKFIEADEVVYVTGKRPVVLLDDVFSELDSKRQKCLVKNFQDNQVVISGV